MQSEVEGQRVDVWVLVDCSSSWRRWEGAEEEDGRCQTWDEKDDKLYYYLRVLRTGE
jgi:hypothetical protein